MTDTDFNPDSGLLWLDLETTGIDPHAGVILEMAATLTDMNGQPKADMQFVLPHRREDILLQMDDYVLQMHLSSGLLQEVTRERLNFEEARRSGWVQLNRIFCSTAASRFKTIHLAGNSIHFDRSWLDVHQPTVLQAVSHRMLDVSSFLLVRPDWRSGDAVKHRARDDVDMSLRIYTDSILPALKN